jgi:multidrug resistance efflux pump
VNRKARHDHEHEAHLAKAKAALEELDAQIQLLQAKAEKQAADARIEYGNELEDLRRRRDELGERLKELQQTSGDAWNDLQHGLESAMASMRDSLKSAIDRFR